MNQKSNAIYTAFCQQASGGGTIWIETVEAPDQDSAIELARTTCASEWGYDREDVHVLGLALGNVNILMWDDIDE